MQQDKRLEERKSYMRSLFSVVDDPKLLKEIAENAYRRKDISASWIGPFCPETFNTSFTFDKVTAKDLARWARAHWMIYDSFIDEFCTRNEDILDVGCGSGNTTNLLSVLFPFNKIIALDSDKKTIKFCKKYNATTNIEFIHSELEKWDKDNKFGYIFACEVLEHLNYDKQFVFLDKCLDLLTENGLLFITTPNSIDEPPEGHHKGLLNRERFLNFYSQYEKNIHSFSFIDNQKLISCSKGVEAVYKEEYEMFDARDKNRSHFRIVMKKEKE